MFIQNLVLAAGLLAIPSNAEVHIISVPIKELIPTATGCTTTITRTYSQLPTPPYWPQCSFDATVRIYPATSTVYNSIECNGCAAVRILNVPAIPCPLPVADATVQESTAKTVYSTVCAVGSAEATVV
ncbi:hypothetical protein HJFPF1_05430 [Paramyrothecium foliicola]|nr:hypothetical protein HJFPF1_05430 [Paramyrothecium foliicola]